MQFQTSIQLFSKNRKYKRNTLKCSECLFAYVELYTIFPCLYFPRFLKRPYVICIMKIISKIPKIEFSESFIKKIWVLLTFSTGTFEVPHSFFFFFFCLFRAAPAVYGGSQARGLTGAAATHLHHSHSNVGSKPHLQPTPQLMANAGSLTH